MAEIHPDAPMDEAQAREKAKSLIEIEATVNAALAIARAVSGKEEDLRKMIDDLERAYQTKYAEFLSLVVAISSLRHRPPEEIVIALGIWKQRMEELKAKEFLLYRYDRNEVC